MTCTAESLLPLEDMNLYGIFRLMPPPEHLAVDYLLLVAANEGHLLQRDAIVALYRAKCRDLRGALSELQFFCQMAIGDRKGSLAWMLLDSPSHSAETSHPELLRVVSEDTYLKNMGWLSGDVPNDQLQTTLEKDVDALSMACNAWDIDLDSYEDLDPLNVYNSLHAEKLKLEQLPDLVNICDTYSRSSTNQRAQKSRLGTPRSITNGA